MDRVHRIFANGQEAFKAFLDRAGIPHKYEESVVGNTIFILMPESDPNWPRLAGALSAYTVLHTVGLSFTAREIRAAEWCHLGVTSHFGYPQPEDGYRELTYRPQSGCSHCGVGYEQAAPFRFRKAPSQNRPRLVQLNWVFDECFISAQARAELESAGLSGVDCQPPILHRTGEPLSGWFQMRVRAILPALTNTQRLRPEGCPVCEAIKFNYPTDEVLELLSKPPATTPDVVKTSEWFGSGGSAFRAVLVSRRFVNAVFDAGWRGVSFQPVHVNTRDAAA